MGNIPVQMKTRNMPISFKIMFKNIKKIKKEKDRLQKC